MTWAGITEDGLRIYEIGPGVLLILGGEYCLQIQIRKDCEKAIKLQILFPRDHVLTQHTTFSRGRSRTLFGFQPNADAEKGPGTECVNLKFNVSEEETPDNRIIQ